MLPNPYILLGAAGAWLLSLIACGWLMYARGHDDMRNVYTEQALAGTKKVLDQFTADADAIHGAAQSFGGIRDDLSAKLATVSRDFNAAIKAKPLPVDCKPDAVRLHALSNAIAATNTAAGLQSGPAVPAHP